MLTKEQILEKHCSAEPNEADTYLDFRHNTIDGSSDHVLAAMEEYAEQQVRLALEKRDKEEELPCWDSRVGIVPCFEENDK